MKGEQNYLINGKGLLSGISDIRDARFYSENILEENACQLLQDRKRIFSICLTNAGNDNETLIKMLRNMTEAAKAFIKSDEVWDRKEIISIMDTIVSSEGNFACVLAGKTLASLLFLPILKNDFLIKSLK